MTFYSDSLDPRFRFGDIIKGFTTVTPVINNPPLESENINFQIEVVRSGFYSVLSPCCSINENIVVLCPLVQLRSTFLTNPYLVEDFTRINRPMTPEQAVPPNVWEKLPPHEKERRKAVGFRFAFVEQFVFNEHPIFPQYFLNARSGEKREIQMYMVDFRHSFSVKCDKITNNSTPFENIKLLQLSIEARAELRNKVTFFYSRVPEEDNLLSD